MTPDKAAPTAGEVAQIADGVQRILAPNPSPMTFWGTNTYLVGDAKCAVIDPGPDDEVHFDAILRALTGREVTHIFVTHSHLDHSPLAARLSQATNAPVVGFGGPTAGRSDIMTELARDGLVGGGEGIDHDFRPDILLGDAGVIDADWGRITGIHTPGHLGNHMCFQWDNTLFCGDHVMGWASSLVSPPDGDLRDFMQSCRSLQTRKVDTFLSGHGPTITDPADRLDWLISHRQARSESILDALEAGSASPAELTRRIYHDTHPALWPAAQRNVLAHLIALHQDSLVTVEGRLSADANFRIS